MLELLYILAKMQKKNGLKPNRLRKKSRIRETKNISTEADRPTDTILGRLPDLSFFFNERLHDFLNKKYSESVIFLLKK